MADGDGEHELAGDIEAWLRADQFGNQLNEWLADQLRPLILYCLDRDLDVREVVLDPAQTILRRTADQLGADLAARIANLDDGGP